MRVVIRIGPIAVYERCFGTVLLRSQSASAAEPVPPKRQVADVDGNRSEPIVLL